MCLFGVDPMSFQIFATQESLFIVGPKALSRGSGRIMECGFRAWCPGLGSAGASGALAKRFLVHQQRCGRSQSMATVD